MYYSFFKKLHCPFCASKFVLTDLFFGTRKRIIHGIVSCQCGKWPILDGVMFLSRNKAKERALRFLLKEKKNLRALSDIPLFLFRLPLGIKASVFLVSFFSRVSILEFFSFSQLVRLLACLRVFESEWASYLLRRFEDRIFFPAAISSSLIKKGGVVLDAGCGTGHLLRLLKKRNKKENICGADIRLINLYLAKSYACGDCNYIYLDLDYSLPFRTGSIQNIFCNDVFHYVVNRQLLAREFIRITNNQGLIILNHLHNRNFANFFQNPNEFSDTPKGYISFFPKFNFSMFSEELVDDGILRYVKEKDISNQAKKLKTFTLIFFKGKKRKLRSDIFVNLKNIITEKTL